MNPSLKRKHLNAYFSFSFSFGFAVTLFCFLLISQMADMNLVYASASSGFASSNQGKEMFSSSVVNLSFGIPSAFFIKSPFASRMLARLPTPKYSVLSRWVLRKKNCSHLLMPGETPTVTLLRFGGRWIRLLSRL